MEESVKYEVIKLIPNITLATQTVDQTPKNLREIREGAEEITKEHVPIVHTDAVGRNEECPCGSGKKWKKCGMQETEEHSLNMSKKHLG